MVKDVVLGERSIGEGYPPFVIAEMSASHNQSLQHALTIVDVAARCGVHALKIQTYTPDTMTLDLTHNEFFIADSASLWKGKSLYQLYQEAQTPWDWHKPIMERAKSLGIIAFSTPFDETAVDLLEDLNVPCYKIASFENTHLPLIRKVASTGKPVIISTGMASVSELDETVRTARQNGCKDLILLKCTSSYPASPEGTNILTIPHMRELFQSQVGISDHTLGCGVAVASVALGATVIEKHITINRADGGVDSAFSLEPQEMESLVIESKRAWQARGSVSYGPTDDKERRSMVFRRSIYVTRDIEKGEKFTRENIRILRPSLGLAPKYYELALGKRSSTFLRRGTALDWSHLS